MRRTAHMDGLQMDFKAKEKHGGYGGSKRNVEGLGFEGEVAV